ncbi:Fc.00g110400.m01.CDS01 [Cosmosporella sp. VM-42]
MENFRPADSPHDIVGMFSWIDPKRLGKRAILDGAICSLALHLTGKETRNYQLIAQSRSLYGQCLNELQATLQHASEWNSSETLCSTILLCFYELFAGTSAPDTWLQHAKGVGVLMEQRGPDAHAEGWDAAMLLCFRGILIMSDMFYPREDDCFLSRPQWKRVMHDGGRHLIHPPDVPDDTIRMVDGFFDNLADIPEVLKWGYRLREANKAGIPVEPARASALAHLAAENHARFTKWYDDEFTQGQLLVLPTEIPSANPTASLYATVLDHPQPWTGSMHLAYWASMLILQETLTQCAWPENFDESQRDFVQNILRSVETVGRGTMGPYRVGYSLRIAYEFASADAQEWIRGLLDGYSKSYAAMDKSLYPTTRLDEEGYTPDNSNRHQGRRQYATRLDR